MIQWLVIFAVKMLKVAIVGVVAMASSCQRPADPPEPPAVGGSSPRTGSAVMMRELGACDLPAVDCPAVVVPDVRLDLDAA